MSTPTKILTLLLATALTVTACSEGSNVGPDVQPGVARVPINVAAAPSLNTLVVEITAADITTPLSYNLRIVDGSASDTLTIPAGQAGAIGAQGPQGPAGPAGEDAPGGLALPIIALVLAAIASGVAVMAMRRKV